MYSKSDSFIEIMIGNKTDETIEKLFEFLLKKYQNSLEEWLKRSKFVFDSVDLLYCKLHKFRLR